MGRHTSETVIVLKDKFSGTMTNIVNSMSKGMLVNKKLIREMEQTSKAFRNFGTMTMAPIIAIGASSIKAAIDSEQAFHKVFTIMDESQKSRKQIMSEMRDTQISYGQSISDVADTYYQVISATVDTANAYKMVDIASKMALGGFAEMSTAVNGLTTAYQAYNKQGYEAERLGDILAMTQKYGKTTINELSGSLGEVVQNAVALNMSFEDLGTSLAVLTSNGANTSTATVFLNNALKSIIQPSKQARDAFKSLGIEYGANAFDGRSFEDYLNKIKQATGLSKIANEELVKLMNNTEMTDEEITEYYRRSGVNADLLLTMFKNIRGATAMLSLTNNLDKYNRFREGMKEENSNGELTRIANEMKDTTKFKMDQLVQKIEVIKSNLGDSLIPKLLPHLDTFDEFITNNLKTMTRSEFDELADKLITGFKISGISLLISTILSIFIKFTDFINKVAIPVGTFLKKIGIDFGSSASTASGKWAMGSTFMKANAALIGWNLGFKLGETKIADSSLFGANHPLFAEDKNEPYTNSEGNTAYAIKPVEYEVYDPITNTWSYVFKELDNKINQIEEKAQNKNPFINPNVQFRPIPNSNIDNNTINENNKNITIQSVNVYGANNIDEITDEVSRYIANNAK